MQTAMNHIQIKCSQTQLDICDMNQMNGKILSDCRRTAPVDLAIVLH